MPEKKLVKVLTIDGGGIRGIIPAMVLAELEKCVGKPASEIFDLIAGTSVGGIIALGVNVPESGAAVGAQEKRPRWSAQKLADMFVSEGSKIFDPSLVRKIETGDGVLKERYSAKGLEKALKKYMGETQLSEALTKVLITSYDIQSHNPFFFKSFTPPPHPEGTKTPPSNPAPAPLPDYPMRVVARATSAAPTYFEPESVPSAPPASGGPAPGFALVDGGTFANNPAMCAYAEALRDEPDAKVLIVSLGTGRITEGIPYKKAKHWGLVCWARPLLNVMMDGSSAAIDYQLDELLGQDEGHYRFQTVLDHASDSLDDASPQNIANLQRAAKRLLKDEAPRIEAICELLRQQPGLRR